MLLTDKIKNIFKSNTNTTNNNNFIKKIFNKISLSVDGTNNVVSTNRVQSYFIMIPALIMVFSIIIIEIINAIISWNTGKPYTISNEFIVVFGMTLSHHLTVLFNRNKPKDETVENSQDKPLEDKPLEGAIKEDKPLEDKPINNIDDTTNK